MLYLSVLCVVNKKMLDIRTLPHSEVSLFFDSLLNYSCIHFVSFVLTLYDCV